MVGESIAINGACMTITKLKKRTVTVHVMHESLMKTNLKDLRVGDRVNGEFAITPATRLNGHLTTGHVDCVIELIDQQPDGQSVDLTFQVPHQFMPFIISKGSVAINGVSLTVAAVNEANDTFKVCVIPHTQLVTNLMDKNTKFFNLECDYYVKTLFNLQKHLK